MSPPSISTPLPELRRRLPWLFMLPGDIGLFLKSARTDARIARERECHGARAAFEAAYSGSGDPWGSESRRYRYQALKYDKLIGLLPPRRYARALDLGCGTGLLSQKLAQRADRVLGIDIAAAAIDRARARRGRAGSVEFQQGDILQLPPGLEGGFDLIVLADVLYYLSPLDEAALTALMGRVAALLAPGGICLVANHYFFSADPDSRLSRRIHSAFVNYPGLRTLSEHRRAFFLASLFAPAKG